MTFWGLLGIVLSSAGVFASILGAFLTYAARQNGQATRELIRTMKAETVAILSEMDRRADERHREVIQVITALKAG